MHHWSSLAKVFNNYTDSPQKQQELRMDVEQKYKHMQAVFTVHYQYSRIMQVHVISIHRIEMVST